MVLVVFVIPRGGLIQRSHVRTRRRKLFLQKLLEQMMVAVGIPVQAAQKGIGAAQIFHDRMGVVPAG